VVVEMLIPPLFLNEYENMNSDFPFDLSIHKRDTGYPLHRHNFAEFLFVTKGCGIEIINGQKREMKVGDFTFLLPYQVHEICMENGDEVEFYNCNIALDPFFESDEISKSLYSILFCADDVPASVHLKKEEQVIMNSLLQDMLHQFSHRSLTNKLLFRANLIKVIVMFHNIRYGKDDAMINANKPKSNIWKVIHYVHSHYFEDIKLKNLAEQFHYSVPYLSAAFKQYVGQNFNEFLHEIRLKHACSLLTSTDMSIVDIAIESGFESYITFLRVFKDHNNTSPANYRKQKTKSINISS
jgi:YesN/AraC family two-component response regulator